MKAAQAAEAAQAAQAVQAAETAPEAAETLTGKKRSINGQERRRLEQAEGAALLRQFGDWHDDPRANARPKSLQITPMEKMALLQTVADRTAVRFERECAPCALEPPCVLEPPYQLALTFKSARSARRAINEARAAELDRRERLVNEMERRARQDLQQSVNNQHLLDWFQNCASTVNPDLARALIPLRASLSPMQLTTRVRFLPRIRGREGLDSFPLVTDVRRRSSTSGRAARGAEGGRRAGGRAQARGAGLPRQRAASAMSGWVEASHERADARGAPMVGVCVCICVWRGEGELERAPREPEAERESRAGVASRSRAMLPARWSFTESLSRFFGVRVRTTVRAFTTERSVSCCAATPTRRRTVRVSVWRVRSRKTQRSVYCFAVCEATFYELSPHVHAPIPRARSAARPR